MPDGEEDAYASSDDDLLFGSHPAHDDDASSDGPAFIGFDGGSLSGNRSVAVDAFNFNTPHASDEEDDEYDAAYARQTRQALARMIEGADAALYGELTAAQTPRQSIPSAVSECAHWHDTLGCIRVCGVASGTAGVQGGIGDAPTAAGSDDDDDGGSLSDAGSSPLARPVVPDSQHCVLSAALASDKLELGITGVRVTPSPCADSAAADEEVIASHGSLIEPIAAHGACPATSAGSASAVASAPPPEPLLRAAQRHRSEAWVLQKHGLPPRTPALAVAEIVLSGLVDRLWRSVVVPALSILPLVAAKTLIEGRREEGVGADALQGLMLAAGPQALPQPPPGQPHTPLPPLSPPRFAAGAGGAAAAALRSLGPGQPRARSAAPHGDGSGRTALAASMTAAPAGSAEGGATHRGIPAGPSSLPWHGGGSARNQGAAAARRGAAAGSSGVAPSGNRANAASTAAAAAPRG